MNKIKTATLQGKWTGDAESNNRWYVEQALALKGKGIDLVVLPQPARKAVAGHRQGNRGGHRVPVLREARPRHIPQ